MFTKKRIWILLNFFWFHSAMADNYHFLLGAGLNFLLAHEEQIATFQTEPITAHFVDYFPGPAFWMGGAYTAHHWALEPDYFFLFNNLNQARGPNVPTTTSNLTTGYTYSHNLLINGLIFPSEYHKITPYLGAGPGINYVYVNQSLGFPFISPLVVGNGAIAFAFNLFAGVSYHLNEFLNLDIRASYLNSNPKLQDQFGNSMNFNYQNISVLISLNSRL